MGDIRVAGTLLRGDSGGMAKGPSAPLFPEAQCLLKYSCPVWPARPCDDFFHGDISLMNVSQQATFQALCC